MTRFAIQVLLLLVVFVLAWSKGGKPEKIIASIYVAMMVLDVGNGLIAGRWDEDHYGSLVTFRFLLDLIAFLGVAGVVILYDRWWTIWVGSAQMISVAAHLLKAADLPIHPYIYSVMERWPVWLAIVITGLGTLLHWRRTRMSAGT